MIRAWALAAAIIWLPVGSFGQDSTATQFPAVGPETSRLTINAATDVAAMVPLINDFQQANPGIAVDYAEFMTNELDASADQACSDNQPLADLIISPAVDALVRYANDGCAASHVSEVTRRIPNSSTFWRDEVFGFTYEPAVIVYDADFIEAADVPRSHGELADLLREEEGRLRGKVTTYDIARSGTGYLLASFDAQQNSTMYGRLLESMARAEAVLDCCSSSMLARIASGEAFIGYNVLGSYAMAAVKDNPSLRIVLPRDYTLVLHRAAVIPRLAPNMEGARLFLDYLLSERGQAVAVQSSFFFSRDGEIPRAIDGPRTLITSGIGRTITIRPTLLAIHDAAQRQRFISEWTAIMVPASTK